LVKLDDKSLYVFFLSEMKSTIFLHRCQSVNLNITLHVTWHQLYGLNVFLNKEAWHERTRPVHEEDADWRVGVVDNILLLIKAQLTRSSVFVVSSGITCVVLPVRTDTFLNTLNLRDWRYRRMACRHSFASSELCR